MSRTTVRKSLCSIVVFGICTLVPISGRSAAQGTAVPPDVQRAQLAIEQAKLDLEKSKYWRDVFVEIAKALVAGAAVAVPLFLGVKAYSAQAATQRRNEEFQFLLKAAEITMDARDSSEAVRKAAFLKDLFPKQLADLEAKMPKAGFSRSMDDRLELLKILAQYPTERAAVLRAWKWMFPWDGDKATWNGLTQPQRDQYSWLERLAQDEVVVNTPAARAT